MRKKKIVAMLLAGGQGSRLGALTHHMAKPAVPFGGKYRIIDFPLSNCANSDIDTVGVLTQYEPLALNAYIGNGAAWDLDRNLGGVYVLPPYVKSGERGDWYTGTANAIYQNELFLDQYDPDCVLILSGDHIYKMDYAKMLRFHQLKHADATIAVKTVPLEEASRFGIMNTDDTGRIVEFEEKPEHPKSCNASMGIYIFDWPVLHRYLQEDDQNPDSTHDFGKDIIPAMLSGGCNLYAYEFSGYWKDVGTVQSLWESNMDLLSSPPALDLHDKEWRIYSRNPVMPPHFAADGAQITNTLICEGAQIYGKIHHSVIFFGATIGKGANVTDSIIMPGARIEEGAVITKAIVGENTTVGAGARIGDPGGNCDGSIDNSLTGDITLISSDLSVPPGMHVPCGTLLSTELLCEICKGGLKA